jgi:hypothetical protein
MSRASTLVKNAALAMVGTSLLIFPAAAQQMAANTPNFSACDQLSRTDPAGAVSCRVKALNAHAAEARRDTAVAEKRIQTATSEEQCVDRIKSELAAGRFPYGHTCREREPCPAAAC